MPRNCKSCGTTENMVPKRRDCRKCFSDRINFVRMKKRADENPEAHCMCDNCDRIMAKRKAGGGNVLITSCKYCGSNSLIEYGV